LVLRYLQRLDPAPEHFPAAWVALTPQQQIESVQRLIALVGLLLGIAGLAVNNHMVRQEQLHTQEEQFRTRDALNRAEQEKAIAQAVRDFLRFKLLAQANPRTQTGPKPYPTIRELLAGAGAAANAARQPPGGADELARPAG
jgi:hypothetical protein